MSYANNRHNKARGRRSSATLNNGLTQYTRRATYGDRTRASHLHPRRAGRILPFGQRMSTCSGLSVSLISLVVVLPHPVAAGVIDKDGQQARESIVGVISTSVDCLSVPGDDLSTDTACPSGTRGDTTSEGIVTLYWQGELERARLVLKLVGTSAAHPIYVNGKQAALTPVHADSASYEVFYLTIPPDIVVQGDNLVEITDDGLPGDGWRAADVRIEAFGSPTDTGFRPLPASAGAARFPSPVRSAWRTTACCSWTSCRSIGRTRWRFFGSRWRTAR